MPRPDDGSTSWRRLCKDQPVMLLYPDTNILLHYRRLDEIDWRATADADEVILVVAHVVIRELEQHKYQHPVKRIRRRADGVVSFLHGQLSDGMESGLPVEVREGVLLDFQRGEPRSDFAAAGLVGTNQDDHLIASVLAFRAETPDADARIVTADLGLRVKAFQHQIRVLELPDDLRIGEGPDPQEREIAELQQKLVRYKQASPQVGLVFDDGESFMKFSPPVANVLDDEEQREALARVREENPKMVAGERPERAARLPGGIDLAHLDRVMGRIGPSEEAIERYNEKLDDFYESYGKYLETRAEHRVLMASTTPLALSLVNGGTAPADDVDVFLDFPAGVMVLDADDFPGEPAPPKPPETPRSRSIFDYQNRLTGLTHLVTPRMPVFQPVMANVSGPTIEEGESPVVSYHVRRLKHNQRERLDELRVVLAAEAKIRSFSIDYRIHVGNLPDEIVGKLHVAIEPEGGPREDAR